MSPGLSAPRVLATMIVYGYPELSLADDLAIASRIGARALEILPLWNVQPDPQELRRQVADAGFQIHSAHGCWGGQTVRAGRVDLGHPDERTHRESIDDLRFCVDWLAHAGGRFLVVHPGGLSTADDFTTRRATLAQGLGRLADHAVGTGITVCVENMPPGVYPGSRMADLAALVAELNRPELALALDTGHAHISLDVVAETLAAGSLLRTTHVHDNNGRQDVHLPPGHGTIDWDAWGRALDQVGYDGPIMLECIRHFRNEPASLNPRLVSLLDRLTGRVSGS